MTPAKLLQSLHACTSYGRQVVKSANILGSNMQGGSFLLIFNAWLCTNFQQ